MAHESQMLLPLYIENVLVDRIKMYVELGFPPYTDIILNAAEAMGGIRPADNWLSRFHEHHHEVRHSRYLHRVVKERVDACRSSNLEIFFDVYSDTIDKY